MTTRSSATRANPRGCRRPDTQASNVRLEIPSTAAAIVAAYVFYGPELAAWYSFCAIGGYMARRLATPTIRGNSP